MPGTNLIQNPGFETGNFADWTVTDPEPENPDIGVDSQPLDVHSGHYGVFAGNETTTLSQTINTVVGHVYSVSFYLDVYQSTAYDGSVVVIFGGQAVQVLAEPAETDAFLKYTVPVTATATSSVLEFTFTDPGGYYGLDDVSVIDTSACYVRGTRIRAAHGEVEIENLRIGDQVMTVSGSLEQIRWIGRRSYTSADLQRRPDLLPIRFRTGSLAERSPARDLLVSQRHAMYLDGVLVPAECLVNGVSIVCEPARAELEYFHVELAEHNVIIAEGAYSESFVDDDSRRMFNNAAEYSRLYPDSARVPALYYAARICDGYAVEAIRERLDARAGNLPARAA